MASKITTANLVRNPLPWLKLLMGLLIVAAVWLIALPQLARTTAIERHIAEQERQGIDPSALFYSELEILPQIAHRYERLHHSHGDELWGREKSGAN
jgi:hypothetical protein